VSEANERLSLAALQKAIKYKNENRREMLDARDRRQRRKRLLWRLRKSAS